MIKTKKERLIDSITSTKAKVLSSELGYEPIITDLTLEELSNGRGDVYDDLETEPSYDPESELYARQG